MAAAASKDKIPPHDDELERATLGGLLQDAEAVSAVIDQRLRPEDFYANANRRIFEAILSLDGKGLRADIQTVVQELRALGRIDESGGPANVASLTTVIPSSANIDYYVKAVQSYSLRRALLRVASEIGAKIYDESLEARVILEEIQQKIFDLSDNRNILSFRPIGEVLKETITIIDNVRKSKNPITGIPSGFESLDRLTSGFQPSDFIVIGARPSVGKTALALNMASHMAFGRNNISVAFFSLEMSNIALVQRLISSEGMIKGNDLRSGFLSGGDYGKILQVCAKMYEAAFYIVDMPNMKLMDLRSQARKLRAQQGIQIIFVDYLGLISHENVMMPRYEQISDISRSLKGLARELKVPIVVLCQLNREAQWETPTLANLRDSGSIEQDADLVLFLHKKQNKKNKKKDEEEEPVHSDTIPTDLIIAKQRNGPVGTIEMALQTKFAKFTPLFKEH
ncbi:MAG: replicative DNA helicase [Treponema sp.]|jgi:replicative DNA helicase|nr:replicative DNA helicase [Treponema sp.]